MKRFKGIQGKTGTIIEQALSDDGLEVRTSRTLFRYAFAVLPFTAPP